MAFFLLYVASVMMCTLHLAEPSELPFTFEGEIITSWNVTDGTRLEGICQFRVDESISQGTVAFSVDFGINITDFQNWVGNIQSEDGQTYQLTNKYDIHPPTLDVHFHAKYTGDIPPTITCAGDLLPADSDGSYGSPCISDPLTCVGEYAVCTEGMCACSDNGKDDNYNCLAPLGGVCDVTTNVLCGNNQQCLEDTDPTSDTYSDQICMCVDGYVPIGGTPTYGGACIQQSVLGESCLTFVTDICALPETTICDAAGACVCREGAVEVSGECVFVSVASLGGVCDVTTNVLCGNNQQCTNDTDPNSDTYSDQVCMCADGYVAIADFCIQQGVLGESCLPFVTDICAPPETTTCDAAGVCVCREGAVEVSGECEFGT